MYLYPKWTRLWHLINALLCLLLIITGLSLQYSGPSRNLVPFEKAVVIHNTGGIMLSLSYLFFFFGNLFTSNRKHYRIRHQNLWKGMLIQFRYYAYGTFKGEKNPFTVSRNDKFNPLQKVSYVFIMYLCIPLVILTGWGLLFPDKTLPGLFGVSGLILADILHIISGFLVSVFMIIHIYLCTMGPTPTSLYWSIMSGYHRSED